ncbi:MAG: OmpA family protein [Pseudomonadota bacterium]
MPPRASTAASTLLAGLAFGLAQAGDPCATPVVYAVRQVCQPLPNGQVMCQPVALTGPAPTCAMPHGARLAAVPLAPPSLYVPQQAAYPFAYAPPAFMPVAPGAPMAWTAPQPPAPTGMPPHAPTVPPPVPVPPPMPVPPSATAQLAPAIQVTPEPARLTPPAIPAAATAPPPAPPAQPAATGVVVEDAHAHFAFDSAELSAAGRATLDIWLAGLPRGQRVVVTGHTDRLGPLAYNLVLSRRRAEAARQHLVARGKPAGEMRVVAMGERMPIKHCKGVASPATKACLAPNRRVEITPE